MTERTIFIAGTYQQAKHWAHAWGFAPHEWIWHGPNVALRGMQLDIPAFVCGNVPIPREVLWAVWPMGVTTFINAHDLDPRERLDALELLPMAPTQGYTPPQHPKKG